MARIAQTVGNIKNGILHIIDQTAKTAFYDVFATWPNCEVELIVKPIGKKRSTSQNRYYRGIVVPMIAAAMTDSLGEDVDEDEAHELLKRKFNLRMIETSNGSVKIPGSTTRLNTVEFMEYVEKCRNWANEFFGLNIPDPVTIQGAKQELKA